MISLKLRGLVMYVIAAALLAFVITSVMLPVKANDNIMVKHKLPVAALYVAPYPYDHVHSCTVTASSSSAVKWTYKETDTNHNTACRLFVALGGEAAGV